MKARRLVIIIITALMIATLSSAVQADSAMVVSLGADLSETQRQQMLDYFGVKNKRESLRIIEVTNQEERSYLKGLVSEDVIGSRAISSAYCEILPPGEGMQVETHNITWVTSFMYADSLTTAGVKDAKVIVAAPFPVSGTAALTGIIKAFETATGEKLPERSKEVAHREMVETSELGQKVGKDKAETLIYRVKREVIERRVTDKREIREIVVKIAGDVGVKLSDADVDRITDLMMQIRDLNVNISQLNKQLESLRGRLDQLDRTATETKGILEQILAFLKSLIARITSFIA